MSSVWIKKTARRQPVAAIRMKNLKVSTKLSLIVAVSAIGLLVFGVLSYYTVERLKVGGPIQNQLALYSDLTGNIAPPPLDIERVRYAVLAMLSDEKENLPRDLKLYRHRKKEYESAITAWTQSLPDGKLKDLIIQGYDPAKRYFDVIENQVYPALARGDKKEAMAALPKGIEFAEASAAATQEAVELSQETQTELNDKAAKTSHSSVVVLVAVGTVIALIVCVMGVATSRTISSATLKALRFANAIAEGNLTQEDIKIEGRDELAEMGRSLNTMKWSLREKAAATSRMIGLADKTNVSLVFADRDLKIQYINPAGNRILEALEQHLPVKASAMIGQPFDILHKDLESQRRFLADPSALPVRITLNIGPEMIALVADAVYDSATNHIGTLTTWEVVTEKSKIEAQNADFAGQIAAIGKSQAVIEFDMHGTIVTANDNFLQTLGYGLSEVKGRHHSMFVEQSYIVSPEYREFWAKLKRGEYVADK